MSGPITSSEVRETSANLIRHMLRMDRTLKALESLGVIDSERSVQELFTSNIAFQNGRYKVRLPWKDPCASISDNLRLSQRRLMTLLQRLRKDPEVLKEYDAVIQQQKKMGIIEKVEHPGEVKSTRVHYLPHHAVLIRDKETTMLRVVYDALAKEEGLSLNQCLYTGVVTA